MSQDGIVDDKVLLVIEPERMTVLELRVSIICFELFASFSATNVL
jgi:hypothetical protein